MRRLFPLLFIMLFGACANMTPSPIPVATRNFTPTATISPTTTPAPTLTLLNQTLTPAAPTTSTAQLFSDKNQGMSFTYPADWAYLPFGPEVAPGFTLRAPAVGEGPEPIIFAITVESRPATESTARETVDQQLTEVPPELQSSIQRRPVAVGGESAEEVIGLPSRGGAIETFVLHNGRVYLIALQPYDPGNQSLFPYLDRVRVVYDQVINSWKFLN